MPVLVGEVAAQEGKASRGEGGVGGNIQRASSGDRQTKAGDKSAAEE